MNKLSVVVSVFNGEKLLKECLDSVRGLADEIIVIDNSSTDKTNEIAKKYTSKVFLRLNNFMLNVNKNFGFSKASNAWILNLDADEQIEESLKLEIKEKLENADKSVSGFFIPRKNFIFAKWIKHAGWYPDYQLRLFKKEDGKFPEEHVHEMLEVKGKVEYLKNHILHKNYESISQFLQKMPLYTQNEADQLIKNGYIFSWKDIFSFPAKEFMSRFFAREGYKDGFYGLVLSSLMAFYHFVIFLFIWEKNSYKEIDKNESVLIETEKEAKRFYKDLLFWIANQKLADEKNKIKKFILKIVKKLAC